MKDKHAYLIMCHDNFKHLSKLLMALDDVRNDIYIHIDKKVVNFPLKDIENSVKEASVVWVERIPVGWGGDSQIKVELNLLEAATKSYHSYYHLISGVDFPLKSQDYIHQYFADNQGSEFIRFDDNFIRNKEFIDRIRYYYFFQNIIGRNSGKVPALFYRLQNCFLFFQKQLHLDRTKKYSFGIYKGTNWFSITHKMAIYLLQNIHIIDKLCNHSFCADEIFLQTIAMMSPYKNKIVNDSLRHIDWNRGNPYTFRDEDFQELKKTDRIYARKFDEKISMMLVNKIYDNIKSDYSNKKDIENL